MISFNSTEMIIKSLEEKTIDKPTPIREDLKLYKPN